MPKAIMLFFVFCVIGLISAAPEKQLCSEDESLALFEEFIKVHNKQYSNEEKEERYKIFVNNLKEINNYNERSSHATFGVTFFTDLTNEEFLQHYTGYKSKENSSWKEFERTTTVPELFNYSVPDDFDWRSKGVVSKVKDQGQCKSGWAFSTTGNVESINAIKSGKIVEVSEQQLVDCVSKSRGCIEGSPLEALSYLVGKGAMSSQSYPFQGYNSDCRYNSSNIVIKLKNMESLKLSEEDMKKKLYTTGPLSIAIAAKSIKLYAGGILVEGCEDSQINHAVLLVGYGEADGIPYWLIKNSWGTFWGDQGYFRIKRGVNCLHLNKDGIFTASI